MPLVSSLIIFLVGWFFLILVGGSLLIRSMISNVQVYVSIVEDVATLVLDSSVVTTSWIFGVATSGVTLSLCTWVFATSIRLTISSSSNTPAKSF